jgi:hypothetical protein
MYVRICMYVCMYVCVCMYLMQCNVCNIISDLYDTTFCRQQKIELLHKQTYSLKASG